jgi:hypothetical protein
MNHAAITRTFGKQSGGGRREGDRALTPLPAMIFGVRLSCAAELIDLSPTGARLRGTPMPDANKDVELELEGVVRFATVVWSRGDQCGLRFAERLTAFEVNQLRHSANLTRSSKLSVEERRILEDWMIGIAR